MKHNDIYKYSFNDEAYKKDIASWHCFDGILICRENNCKFFLVDTYWSGGDNKIFTPENVNDNGSIEFICNLDDMEYVDNPDYYDEVVTLGIHAGYRTQYLIKKGTQKSPNKMIKVLEEKILETENIIKTNKHKIEYLKKDIEKIQSGDLNVYL